MAWFKDLAPCPYWDRPGESFSAQLRAVGWLEAERPFPQGAIDPAVFERLCELLVNPWVDMDYQYRGSHSCTLCPEGKRTKAFPYRGQKIEQGLFNLFVPGEGYLYVAPSMILHYIALHGYLPPQKFCDAVLRCPPMRSDAYYEAVEQHTPPTWARHAHEDRQVEAFIRETMASDVLPARIMVLDSHEEVHAWFRELAARHSRIMRLEPPTTPAEIIALEHERAAREEAWRAGKLRLPDEGIDNSPEQILQTYHNFTPLPVGLVFLALDWHQDQLRAVRSALYNWGVGDRLVSHQHNHSPRHGRAKLVQDEAHQGPGKAEHGKHQEAHARAAAQRQPGVEWNLIQHTPPLGTAPGLYNALS